MTYSPGSDEAIAAEEATARTDDEIVKRLFDAGVRFDEPTDAEIEASPALCRFYYGT